MRINLICDTDTNLCQNGTSNWVSSATWSIKSEKSFHSIFPDIDVFEISLTNPWMPGAPAIPVITGEQSSSQQYSYHLHWQVLRIHSAAVYCILLNRWSQSTGCDNMRRSTGRPPWSVTAILLWPSLGDKDQYLLSYTNTLAPEGALI